VAQEVLRVQSRFDAAYFGGLRRKIGLTTERDGDVALVNDLLKLMAENAADFTLTFGGCATPPLTRPRTPPSAPCSPILPPSTPGLCVGAGGWGMTGRFRLGSAESVEM